MLFKLLILGFTLLSTAIAQDDTDLDSCGKTCLSVAIASIGCEPTDVACICTTDSKKKLFQALDDCLSATPNCSAAELAAADEGRVLGLLSYFCYDTLPSASLALMSAGAFTTTAPSFTSPASSTEGLTSQILTTQASTTAAESSTTRSGPSPSAASSTSTSFKSSSNGLVGKARVGVLAAVPFTFVAIGGSLALIG